MNREEYFSTNYSNVSYNRTSFRAPFQHRTAFNTGDIVPVMALPILPGDQVKADLSYLLRLFTPLNQIMSNMYVDFYAFFVPYRLVWTHWANFLGENDTSAWTDSTEYTIPVWSVNDSHMLSKNIAVNDDEWNKAFANYLGINPTGITTGGLYKYYDGTVSDLYRRSYLNIFNEWFRDENVVDPILFSKGDTPEVSPTFGYDSYLLKSAKMHDYFTSCVPTPMKGTAPFIGDDLPVVGKFDEDSDPVYHDMGLWSVSDDGSGELDGNFGFDQGPTVDSSNQVQGDLATYSNLVAKMNITIEDIRNAAVVTHVLERLAQTGSRYPEFLKGIWGVTSSDARLQIPEYLAGKRFPIRISEVVSTSDTVGGSGSYLGETGAYLKDGNYSHFFNAAFTEYGQLWVLATIRIEQTYFQGLSRNFTDVNFFDLPLPQTQHIGFTPRTTQEIYAMGTDVDNGGSNPPFGYGPAWDHYRHFPYLATSIMKPNANYGLGSWDASEIYASAPTLNQSFIQQGVSGLDRCIAVSSATRGAFQWFGEFRLDMSWVRVLSADSEPGLMRI